MPQKRCNLLTSGKKMSEYRHNSWKSGQNYRGLLPGLKALGGGAQGARGRPVRNSFQSSKEFHGSGAYPLFAIMLRMRRLARFSIISAGIVAVLSAQAMFTAQADAADVSREIGQNLLREKVFPAGTSITANVDDKGAVVKISPYTCKSDEVMRIDAVLTARTIVEGYPAVASVVVRFPDKSSAGFTDVVVTARQIISFGARTMGRSELLSTLTAISVPSGNPARDTFEKYVLEGDQALSKGEVSKAEQLYGMAVSESPGFLEGARDERLVTGTIALAGSYRNREHYESAERVLKRLLATRDTAGTGDDEGSVKLILALADVYMADSKGSEAAHLLERVVASRRAKNAASGTDYASLLEKLAVCYKTSPTKEAELLRDAVAVREAQAGHEDPSMIQSLERLGDCYLHSNSADARKYYERAIEILNKSMVAKDQKRRMSYEMYTAHMTRIQKKLANMPGGSNYQRQW